MYIPHSYNVVVYLIFINQLVIYVTIDNPINEQIIFIIYNLKQ